MIPILLAFWRICTFASGPNAIPANTTLTALVVGAYSLVTFSAVWLLGEENITILRAAANTIVALAGTAGLVWFVLLMFDRNSRYLQTITAIVGADLLLTLVSLAVYLPINAASPQIASIIAMLIFLWTLAVYGFIFHRALEIHFGFGLALAVFVVIFTIAITQTAIAQ